MRVSFIIESTTDVRMIEGLATRAELTLIGRQSDTSELVTQTPITRYTTVIGPTSRSAFAVFVGRYLREKRHEIDAVLVQGYGLAALATNFAARSTRTSTFMLICSPLEAYYRCRLTAGDPLKPFRWHEFMAIASVARANSLLGKNYIVLSRHLEKVVGSRHRVDVVPVYGVDTNVFKPTTQTKASLRSLMGLPASGALIFFSSRIAPEKDSETLLKAFKMLLNQGHDLWLLNRSGGYQAIQKAAARLGVEDRVIATDAVHPQMQLPLSYQAADVCVQASREEGLGFSALEALACGTPVVATAVGGLKETIIDGQTGWTYPVENDQALAAQILEVLSHPSEAARRAEAGCAMVKMEYDTCIAFDRLLAVIGQR